MRNEKQGSRVRHKARQYLKPRTSPDTEHAQKLFHLGPPILFTPHTCSAQGAIGDRPRLQDGAARRLQGHPSAAMTRCTLHRTPSPLLQRPLTCAVRASTSSAPCRSRRLYDLPQTPFRNGGQWCDDTARAFFETPVSTLIKVRRSAAAKSRIHVMSRRFQGWRNERSSRRCRNDMQ